MMTPERLGVLMDRLNRMGYDPSRTIASIFDTDDRRVRRWREGSRPIPEDAGKWLDRFHRFLRDETERDECKRYLKDNPPPQVRGRRDRPRTDPTPANPWGHAKAGSAIEL
jgi:hypothetical protein